MTIPYRPELYIGKSFETDDGMMYEMPIDRLKREELRWQRSGVKNECGTCKRQDAAMLFGDPDGENWCLVCQITSDMEHLTAQATERTTP